ncbi:MAG: hypothetical protein ING75_03640 [Rhodocyclaceae bacterium]|nr:hypothetical protein [Rhodocyclaceae bacterium]
MCTNYRPSSIDLIKVGALEDIRETKIAFKAEVFPNLSMLVLRGSAPTRIVQKSGGGMEHKFFTIKNCEFGYQCPRTWESLATTDVEGERFCETCQRTVQLCRDDATLNRHIEAGHCVAVEDISRGEPRVGQISPASYLPTLNASSNPQRHGLKRAPPVYGTRADPDGKIA